ncbi:MAG: 2'-5' RNA ligase [Candidatus Omnitrophica bacterium 4484_70.2]|nr:MAG: 2'-5' RNA ligase [Candidatus Omnitrophica bacterium 4484_70.2]
MRAFIAFPLPSSIKERLKEIEESLKGYPIKAKWVKPENLHLTLKFLGEIEEEKIADLKKILEEMSNLSKIEVKLTNFGFFPSSSNPRVFFVSLDKEKELNLIDQKLEEKLAPLGFPQEQRFKAHITLARIKEKKNIHLLKEKIKEVRLEEKFFLSQITLFKSILTPSGPIYEEIFKINLKE